MNLVRDRWMFAPILILGVGVGVSAITVSLAVAGRSVGAEPDYYDKALHWNESKAQASLNDRLGWNVSPELIGSVSGMPRLKLSVKDKHGVRIAADAVEVEAIPVRAAELRTAVALTHTQEGEFEGDIPLRISGQWEFRITVHKGTDTYTDSFRRTLSFAQRGAGASPPAPAASQTTP